MKGLIFNLLESAVSDQYGEDAWDDLLDRSGLDGVWASLASYPDAELMRVVAVAAEAFSLSDDEVVRWFGRSAMPYLVDAYPGFFAPHATTFAFLRTLNDIHHLEVRKVHPDAMLPTFTIASSDRGSLTMRYSSDRGLCMFGEGLIHGAADHFGERFLVEQPQCSRRGDAHCVLRVTPAES